MKGTKEQELARYTAELAKPKAGVLEAGVLPLPVAGTGDCRLAAADMMIKLIAEKCYSRNNLLHNVKMGVAAINSTKRAKALQTEIDACLWIITCCALVEIDEAAQRITACPEHLRTTLSEVLGTR